MKILYLSFLRFCVFKPAGVASPIFRFDFDTKTYWKSIRHILRNPFLSEPCSFVLFWPFFALKKPPLRAKSSKEKFCYYQNNRRGLYDNSRGIAKRPRPSWNDFLYFLRPSPAISGPGPEKCSPTPRPETPEKSPEWGRRGPEKVLRKICVFRRFVFFLFILAFWAFISFHFGLLGFHFLSFWAF